MIISEKQIMQLMQFSQSYVIALDTLYQFDKTLLSQCGLHNKVHVAKILMDIANQQSEELTEVINDRMSDEATKELPETGSNGVLGSS